MAAMWQDDEFRAAMVAKIRAGWARRGGLTAAERARIADKQRELWSDPAFRATRARQYRLGWEIRRERLAEEKRAAGVSSGVRT